MPPRAVSSATSPTNCARRCSTSRATWKRSTTWAIKLSEEDRKEFLAIANAETDRLTRLVNDVLDLSRLESRIGSGALSRWSYGPAIEQTLRNYRLNAEDKGVRLSLEVDAQLPRVRGNWDLLLQVFDNLVGNGLKFTPSGGRLMLRAYPWPDTCPARSRTEAQGDSAYLRSHLPPAAAAGGDRRHRLWHFPRRPAADL